MKQLPSLKQLEYLTSLAEHQHFGQASEVCNVTPSTLSAGIRELEETLGVAVAERTKRTVLMTPIGLAIADRAKALIRDAEDLMALAASHNKPLTGKISLGAIPTISPFILPGVFPEIQKKYPQLQLYLREEQTETLLHRLRNGEIDVALIALPYETENLIVKELINDEFLFACPNDHQLANSKSIKDKDLPNQSLLLLEEGHCLRTHALDACKFSSSPMRVQFEATSLQTLIHMVASGIGVTLLPKMAAESAVTQNNKIQLIPLETPAARQIGLAWRSSSPRHEEFELLAELIGECWSN